jgi:DNA (cytosine-5)-methyltransferase 1
MRGVSLFSSAGIAETFLEDVGINITVANELISERGALYQSIYPNSKMLIGSILNKHVFENILAKAGDKVDFLIATPPCQGMSIAGKSRNVSQMLNDERNYLVFRIIDFIQAKSPSFILIENVPAFFKVQLPYHGKVYKIVDILSLLFKQNYHIEAETYDASLYRVPQKRMRAIIKLYKKGLKWGSPSSENPISVREAIGHLPSIEAGQISHIKWHFARKHSPNHIKWMKNTPTGKSAFENEIHFPVKADGEKIKSYMTTYRRIKWDEPAPTITMRNDAISSQLNVHPGRKLDDGTYSDARVLTPFELMLLTSLPENWNIPDNTPEILIRKCIGESVPPLLIKKIASQIDC